MAYQKSKQEWDIYNLSPLQKVNISIKPGEEQELIEMQDFETIVPHKDMENDTERWVVMEFTVKDKQHGKVFFYAHEPQE